MRLPPSQGSGQGCAPPSAGSWGGSRATLRDLHSFFSHAYGRILTAHMSGMLTREGGLIPLSSPEGESVIHRADESGG